MKKRVYVMAVMIAVLMSFSNLTVNAQEKVKLNAASKEKIGRASCRERVSSTV